MNFQVEQLKRLPQRSDDVWQGGLTRMPAWVKEEGEAPYRPWLVGWISLKTKLIHTSSLQPPDKISFETVLNALAEFACNSELAGYRPGKIEVKDSALAEHLGGLLTEADIVVEQRDKLFTFDKMIADMAEHINDHPLGPNIMDVKGVTVGIMRVFAEAACQFYQAKPWQHLSNDDLIEIECLLLMLTYDMLRCLVPAGLLLGWVFSIHCSNLNPYWDKKLLGR